MKHPITGCAQMWTPEELKAIKDKIAAGFASENILIELSTILDNMEKSLLEQFSSPNPIYYQNIDNSPFLMLHLKVRVIRELKQTLTVRVDVGRTALDERAELEKQGAKFSD